MPPLAAIENRVLDAILAACSGIGTPVGSWRTTPYAILDGVPNDEMGALDQPRLFVQHVRSDVPATGNETLTSHNWTLAYNVWIAAQSMRAVLDAKADVLQSMYAAEASFSSSFKLPMFPGSFAFHDDLMKAGIWLGTQAFTIDVETDHVSP